MSGYMKFTPEIEGSATDKNHKKWVRISSMSSGVTRTVPSGGTAVQRAVGTTTLHDIVIVRESDISSTLVFQACAGGKVFSEVSIDVTQQSGDTEQVYLNYKLSNCIISGYSAHVSGSGDPHPTEEMTLNFTKAEWTWTKINPDTLEPDGNVVGKYDASENKAG